MPQHIPVTGKMRLGFEDKSLALENALAMSENGINEIVIHARAKLESYTPPAWWEELAPIAAAVTVPVIANGEIWNPEDYRRAIEQSGCRDVMLGRGLLANPSLAKNVKKLQESSISWPEILFLLQKMQTKQAEVYSKKTANNAVKQWLGYLKLNFSEAEQLFESVKRIREPVAMADKLQSSIEEIKG